MLRSRQCFQGNNADNLLLLLPPDPRWRPPNGCARVLFFPQFFSAARMRGAEKNQGKTIPEYAVLVRLLLESEKKEKKGKKEGKKKEKKRGGALGRARTTDQLVYPDFTVRMRSY